MTGVRKFEDLEAWTSAREFTNMIYGVTRQGPFARDFGLRDQIRRSSISILSNIAEGFESRTDMQFISYLGHARASAGEARAQLYIALDQQYVTSAQFAESLAAVQRCSRQIYNLMRYLERNPRRNRGSGQATPTRA